MTTNHNITNNFLTHWFRCFTSLKWQAWTTDGERSEPIDVSNYGQHGQYGDGRISTVNLPSGSSETNEWRQEGFVHLYTVYEKDTK